MSSSWLPTSFRPRGWSSPSRSVALTWVHCLLHFLFSWYYLTFLISFSHLPFPIIHMIPGAPGLCRQALSAAAAGPTARWGSNNHQDGNLRRSTWGIGGACGSPNELLSHVVPDGIQPKCAPLGWISAVASQGTVADSDGSSSPDPSNEPPLRAPPSWDAAVDP
jgi:hypothetical protein